MTALAAELDEKLARLDPVHAKKLEDMVRSAMALVNVDDKDIEAILNLKVQHMTLSAADWEFLCKALDEPPRDLPRLRKLMQEPSIFKNA